MSKIRQAAKGRECQVRIDPCLCEGTETTVLAHLNGGGMGKKHHDMQGAFCCSRCHTYADGFKHQFYSYEEIKLMFYEGIFRTQQILFDEGLIVTKGSK